MMYACSVPVTYWSIYNYVFMKAVGEILIFLPFSVSSWVLLDALLCSIEPFIFNIQLLDQDEREVLYNMGLLIRPGWSIWYILYLSTTIYFFLFADWFIDVFKGSQWSCWCLFCSFQCCYWQQSNKARRWPPPPSHIFSLILVKPAP